MSKLFAGLGLWGLLVLTSCPLFAADLVEIETRPGVKQRFILDVPEKPVAAVVLIEGGQGTLELGSFLGVPAIGNPSYANGFLARSRGLPAKRGVAAVLIDKPSDRDKLQYPFRTSEEHAKDIRAVVEHVKNKLNVPVWLVGMSAGGLSVGNYATRDTGLIDGLVFASAVTFIPKGLLLSDTLTNGILDMDFRKFSLPVLVLAHKGDDCNQSPPGNSAPIAARFPASRKTEVVFFEGGSPPKSDACLALSPHGFWGIEDKVFDALIAFIKSNPPAKP